MKKFNEFIENKVVTESAEKAVDKIKKYIYDLGLPHTIINYQLFESKKKS